MIDKGTNTSPIKGKSLELNVNESSKINRKTEMTVIQNCGFKNITGVQNDLKKELLILLKNYFATETNFKIIYHMCDVGLNTLTFRYRCYKSKKLGCKTYFTGKYFIDLDLMRIYKYFECSHQKCKKTINI